MEIEFVEKIRESNRLKREACENCKKELRDILSQEQMRKFEEFFYSNARGYIFRMEDAGGVGDT